MHPAVALWPDTAVFCIASLHGRSLWAGVTPGHCAPRAGSTHSSFLEQSKGCLHIMEPQSGFMPCFQETYRRKTIKCGKLCCGVIVTGIFRRFLGNHMTEGAKACGCPREWCIASPDPHCLFVQRLVVSCYEVNHSAGFPCFYERCKWYCPWLLHDLLPL